MSQNRIDAVDVARGVAVVAMIAYHSVWDLWAFRLVGIDLMTDPLWLAARTAILSTFLFISGVTLALSTAGGIVWRRQARRLAILVAAAAAVSAASYYAFPDSPIFFGVLHQLAVASLLGLVLRRLPPLALILGGVAVYALTDVLRTPFFDHPALSWIGLVTVLPRSNDFVPIFPWFGVVMVGIGVGGWWRGRGALGRWTAGTWVSWGLSRLGRITLPVYLVHQPLIYGGMWLAVSLTMPQASPQAASFVDSCAATCQANGLTAERCRTYCACALDRIVPENLLDPISEGRLTPDQNRRVEAIARECFKAP